MGSLTEPCACYVCACVCVRVEGGEGLLHGVSFSNDLCFLSARRAARRHGRSVCGRGGGGGGSRGHQQVECGRGVQLHQQPGRLWRVRPGEDKSRSRAPHTSSPRPSRTGGMPKTERERVDRRGRLGLQIHRVARIRGDEFINSAIRY